MADETPLPPMPAWYARSFWIGVVTAALQIAALTNFDILGLLGMESDTQLIDSIMQVVAVIGMVWMWYERKNPARSLSLDGTGTLKG